MAYGLRYYKELTHPDGKVVRLEILEKGGTIAAKEIGPVCQALRLDIQGDTEIDAPIVKTSLTMTFVDAPDHPEAKAKKCGNWAEFYTSDSTLWQVKVKVKNAKETAFSTIWTGYVTPDSFTEVLQYRGSVTIVARDNIGHLNDFPFDAEGNADGMISLRELVQAAWAKIENPMEVIYYSDDWMLSEGVNALNTMMNVSAFEDMNWYEALESALYGYGATLRWVGGNEVIVRPLRMLPYMGRSVQQTIITQDPIFMSGAERELTPAVRRIEESVSYELDERLAVPLAKSVLFTGATSTIPYNSRTLLDGTKVVNIPTWPIANNTNEGWGNGDKTLFLNPKAYSTTALASELGDSLVLATNTDGSGRVWYGRYMQGKNFTLSVSFGQMIERSNSSLVTIMFNPVTVKKVVASISATANGITKYLNEGGVWQTSEVFIDFEIDAETRSISKSIPIGTFSTSESLVKFTIKDITLGGLDGNDWWDVSDGGGIYVELNSLTYADNSGVALCETNRVNTNYNTENNIILSRDPKIAPALNDVLFPSFIKNGIFVQDGKTYNPAKTWSWEGQTPQQMAVYNHLQLLCYHAKPNNILRGTIVNADNTNLQTLWMWQGAEHMLVSGSLNFLNGYIENAVLREFARYEEMWGMLAPADFPEVEGKSKTTAEGGASTASEGARTTNTTTVNIGGGGGSMTIDTFMSDTSTNAVGNRYIKAYVDGLGDDITEAYEAAISALNTEITNALKGKVDNATFNTLSTQVDTNKTNIGKLDTRLTTAEGEIDTLQTYTTWLDSVKGLIYKDGDNIKINTSLIVSGDTSSEGSGSDTPALGTVTSIKVNNTPYNPNSAGVIDLSEAFNSIDVSDQLANYALTDYVNTQIALVNSALSGKQDALGYTPLSTAGGTITSEGTIFNATFANDIFGYNPSYGVYIGGVAKTGGSWTGAYYLYSGNSTHPCPSFYKYGARHDLIHTGNYADTTDNRYLKLSGGTIEAASTKNGILVIKDSGTTGWGKVVLHHNGALMSAFGADPSNGGFWIQNNQEGSNNKLFAVKTDNLYYGNDTLIHSGNYSDYALPLSGGTIDSTSEEPITIVSNQGQVRLLVKRYAENKSTIGWHQSYGTWMYDHYSGASIGIKSTDGTPFIHNGSSFYTIIHSGNIGSQSVDKANKLATARTIWGQSFDGTGNVSGALSNVGAITRSFQYAVDADQAGNLTFKTNVTEWKFNNSAGSTIVSVNGAGNNVGIGLNNPAYKLDVNGAVRAHGTDATYGGEAFYWGTEGQYNVGSNINSDFYLWTSISADFRLGTSNTERMRVKANGNVGIGTTNPSYSLHVSSTSGDFTKPICVSENKSSSSWIAAHGFLGSGMTSGQYVAIEIGKAFNERNCGHLSFYYNANSSTLNRFALGFYNVVDILVVRADRKVGINTTSPLYDLDVNGDSRISGNLIVAGDTSSGSDIRFKDIISNKTICIEDIANAPLFTFKWNDREDDTIHMGSSAQYWENVCSELVSGEDFKTLNYASLGVAMGISLAKEVIELRKEVKKLKEKLYGC